MKSGSINSCIIHYYYCYYCDYWHRGVGRVELYLYPLWATTGPVTGLLYSTVTTGNSDKITVASVVVVVVVNLTILHKICNWPELRL